MLAWLSFLMLSLADCWSPQARFFWDPGMFCIHQAIHRSDQALFDCTNVDHILNENPQVKCCCASGFKALPGKWFVSPTEDFAPLCLIQVLSDILQESAGSQNVHQQWTLVKRKSPSATLICLSFLTLDYADCWSSQAWFFCDHGMFCIHQAIHRCDQVLLDCSNDGHMLNENPQVKCCCASGFKALQGKLLNPLR
jgi:hypothetical protein